MTQGLDLAIASQLYCLLNKVCWVGCFSVRKWRWQKEMQKFGLLQFKADLFPNIDIKVKFSFLQNIYKSYQRWKKERYKQNDVPYNPKALASFLQEGDLSLFKAFAQKNLSVIDEIAWAVEKARPYP